MAQTSMTDHAILEAALIGLQHQKTQVDVMIADIRRKLGIRGPRVIQVETAEQKPARKRRKMSAAARKRIGDATRKRWAEYRKNKKSA